MNLRKPVLHWLKARTQNTRQNMLQFTRGGFVFAGGMMIVLLSERALTPGILQELSALFGLLIVAAGLLLALWGYLAISLFKILIYLIERNHD